MVVAPFNSKLDGSALVILLDRPVVLIRHQTSGEEIVIMGFHQQGDRVTGKNVFFTDRPRRPFDVDLIPASIALQKHRQ